jgi:hypothetical protein
MTDLKSKVALSVCAAGLFEFSHIFYIHCLKSISKFAFSEA